MPSFVFVPAEDAANRGDFQWHTQTFTLHLLKSLYNDRTEASLAAVLAAAGENDAPEYSSKTTGLNFAINGFQAQRRLTGSPFEWQNLSAGVPIWAALLSIPSLDLPVAHFEADPARTTNGEDVRATFQNVDFLVNVN